MNGKGKKKQKKKAAAKSPGGLLARLFKGDSKAGKKPDKARSSAAGATNGKAKPLSPLERSIQEIKHMAKVGESDPERLAMLLSRLLSQEKEKERQAQEGFDRMVWDIVHREEDDADGETSSDADGDSPPES